LRESSLARLKPRLILFNSSKSNGAKVQKPSKLGKIAGGKPGDVPTQIALEFSLSRSLPAFAGPRNTSRREKMKVTGWR
jgi:hypothetical protein